MEYNFAAPATRRISDDHQVEFKAFDLRPGFWTLRYTRLSTSTIGGIERDKRCTYYISTKYNVVPCRCFCRKPQRIQTFSASAVGNRQLLGGKPTSDKGLFLPTRANKERRMSKILEYT